MKDKEELKLLIITPEGEITSMYMEDYPDVDENEVCNHQHYLNEYIHKICKSRTLRKEAHPLSYFNRLKVLQKYNYTVMLDTTNYSNYHAGKLHEGFIHLPNKMTSEAKEKLIELCPNLFPYVTYLPVGLSVGYLEKKETDEYQDVHNYPELLKELLEEKGITKEEELALEDLINYIKEDKKDSSIDKVEEKLDLLKNKVLVLLNKKNRNEKQKILVK